LTLYNPPVSSDSTDSHPLDEALKTLGIGPTELSELCGITRAWIWKMKQRADDESAKVKRDICRKGLMVQAVLLGIDAWPYRESVIWGLPEPSPDVVMPQVHQHAERIKARREAGSEQQAAGSEGENGRRAAYPTGDTGGTPMPLPTSEVAA
jgi:hypothetical protein